MNTRDIILIFAMSEEYLLFKEAIAKYTHFTIRNECVECSINGTGTLYSLSILYGGESDYHIKCLCVESQGSIDMKAALIRMSDLIKNKINNGYLINIGICGLVDEDNKLGDVLIPHVAYDITVHGKQLDKNRDFAPDPYRIDNEIFQEINQQYINIVNKELEKTHEIAKENLSSIVVGDSILKKYISKNYYNKLIEESQIATGGDVGQGDSFVKDLKKQVHRHLTAYDCETAAVYSFAHQEKLKVLAFRALSDPCDSNKQYVEQKTKKEYRKIAMYNAVIAFGTWFEMYCYDSLNVLKIKNLDFLQFPYNKNTYSASNLLEYSNIFSIRNNCSATMNIYDICCKVKSILNDNKAKTWQERTFSIIGDAHSGKTAVSSVIYHLLNMEKELIPVFIDLNSSSISYSLLIHMKRIVQSDKLCKFIILLDVNMSEYELDKFDPREITQLIESLGCHPVYIIHTSKSCTLHPIDHEFILERQFKIDAKDRVISNRIKSVEFLLKDENKNPPRAMLIFWIAIMTEIKITSFPEAIQKFLSKYFQEEDLISWAEKIYKDWIIITKKWIKANSNRIEFSCENAYKNLFNHADIQHFLIAYHFYILLKEEKDLPDIVLPCYINKYIKFLTKNDDSIQENILKKAKSIDFKNSVMKGIMLPKLTNISYMLGRIEQPSLLSDAKSILIKWAHMLNEILSNKKSHLKNQKEFFEKNQIELLYRSIQISCAYLGDEDKACEYVRRILENSTADQVNRGFHLQYYCDQPLNLSLGYCGKDEGKSITNTYIELKQRILKNSSSDLNERSKSYNIEIATLTSLIYSRCLRKNIDSLDEELKNEIYDFVNNVIPVISRDFSVIPILSNFVKEVKNHIDGKYVHPNDWLLQLTRLKSMPRRGWLLPNTRTSIQFDEEKLPVESVDSHAMSCMRLALFLLPSELGEKKERIIKMLFVHDWAECEIGDLLPHEKTDDTKDAEQKYYDMLMLKGKYFEGEEEIIELCQLWEEFNEGRTEEALIARDIDRFENLWQLHCYKNDNIDIQDKEWEGDLIRQLKTTKMQDIVKKEILPYFSFLARVYK